jgi:XTP/dITP diphosphohydrolase
MSKAEAGEVYRPCRRLSVTACSSLKAVPGGSNEQMKILIASNNPDKRAEMERLMKGLPVEIVSPTEFPDAPRVREDSDTFQENAAKKATELALHSGLHTVADDSGLCVDALGGKPGVLSARYAGLRGTYSDVCKKVLIHMRSVPDGQRTARFECHVAFSDPEGNVVLRAAGICEGAITRQPRGGRGFGYDPVFLYPPAGKTFAQMLPDEKDNCSHRGRALREFKQKLKLFLEEGSPADAGGEPG